MKKYIIISAMALIGLSCEKTIDYDLPQEDPKLSIDTYVIEGEPVTALVGISQPSLSSEYPEVTADAEVWLYEDGVKVSKLEYNSVNPNLYGTYSSDYKPKAGKTYRVEASLDNFETAYGMNLLPEPVPVNADYDTSTNYLSVSFRDPSTSGDYYLIRAFNKRYQNGVFYRDNITLTTSDPVVEIFTDFDDDPLQDDIYKSGRDAYMTDQSFNAKEREVRFKIYERSNGQQDTMVVELLRITEDFYLYDRSKALIYWADDNPFAEPIQVHSNVENGYGIVAGGSKSTTDVIY